MILKNISVLYGNELKLIESTNVQIKNEKFQKISKNISSKEKSIDCSNLLLIPGFVNSHTHIADSIGKDLSINADVDSKIHPMFGLKQKLLKETPKSSLSKYIKKSAKSMIKKGITTFIDFREGGLDGVILLKSALDSIPIRCVILGRIDYYNKWTDINKTWVDSFLNRKVVKNFSLMKAVTGEDEWCAEAYMETDYSLLTEKEYNNTVKDFLKHLVDLE